jgi:endonuclease/exonuclease/phosphatase family metal-dependent hydrolase
MVITRDIVEIIAGQFRQGVIIALLKEKGANVVITKEVVKAAAGNRKSREAVIKLLLEQRGADVVISKEVVKIIAGQFRQGVIMALLKEKGANVVITKEVVKAVAGNQKSREAVIKLLLE